MSTDGSQYAGLTVAERVLAEADPHLSACDVPNFADCPKCWRRVGDLRRRLAALAAADLLGAGLEREIRAKVAYRIRAELVCCDIYDRDAGTDRAGETHGICFWGEAAARIAEGGDTNG